MKTKMIQRLAKVFVDLHQKNKHRAAEWAQRMRPKISPEDWNRLGNEVDAYEAKLKGRKKK